jgi:hypothetical protein
MTEKVVTDYDSDWAVCLQPFDSEAFLDSNDKQLCSVSLAFMLFHLKTLVTTRQNEEAVELLNDGLDQVFVFTDVFHLTKERFLAFLTGKLKPEEEPLHFLKPDVQAYETDER